jgi:hypothetical protein
LRGNAATPDLPAVSPVLEYLYIKIRDWNKSGAGVK